MTRNTRKQPHIDDTGQPGQLRHPEQAGSSGEPAGVVVALCAGHRCAALTKRSGDGGLAAAVARSSGGVLISAPCLQQCAQGAVGAVAIRTPNADSTGPSIWLGGLEASGHLRTLSRWVEQWRPIAGQDNALPQDLSGAVLGLGPPVRLKQVEQ